MHPRNPYRQPPDFSSLAESYPPLKPCLVTTPNGVSIDFKDDVSQRRLTEALLHRDFNLKIVLPEDRLCPPVPNRLNYILWLQDILQASSLGEPVVLEVIRGVDVGTGASAIYPLLGSRTDLRWHFTAIEVDRKSIENARLNVQNNNLQDRITVVESDPRGPILQCLMSDAQARIDFTICNPPFYSSKEDILQSAEAKESYPNAVCTGADVEMIAPGGETAFVSQMVRESVNIRRQCRWYTSMLGKMSSLTEVVTLLRELNIDNYACTEFVQGHTRRWALAWSFDDIRLPDSISRISNPTLQGIMPPHNTIQQTYPQTQVQSAEHLRIVLSTILTTVDGISTVQLPSLGSTSSDINLLVHAPRNTWSRAARRKKANPTGMQTEQDVGTDQAIIVRITSYTRTGSSEKRVDCTVLQFDWVKGMHASRMLFESFASHVVRKVSAVLAA